MRAVSLLGTALVLIGGFGVATTQVTQAVQLRDGKVYFVQPPDLVAATTTFNSVNVWGATYYFTIDVPQQAGEPLQRLEIVQRQGGDNIRFKLADSRAFTGTRDRRGAAMALGEVTQERHNRTVFVNFDPPIPPGQTITVGLRPVRNPRNSGVYLFGVTAFPAGEKAHGQFLGYGRLQFYSGGGRGFGFP